MVSIEDIETPLEPVEYLIRSPNRVTVLDAIDERPRERHELRELTDVSRVTLSRVLANFEDRGWIERTNGRYEITAEGAFVATEITGLLANMQTLESLDGAMAWLPTEAFDFDLRHLRDADVATSSWGDHTGQIRRVAEVTKGADRIRGTASGVSRGVVDAVWDVTVEGDASFEGIYDATALEIVRNDDELRRQHRELHESGNAELYRYVGEETPLLMVMTCDDTVLLCGHDEDGPPPGTLESTDERVHAWAEGYIDAARDDARPIDGDEWSNR